LENKAYRLLGLAKRAGKVVSGTDGVVNSVRYGKAGVVILAKDASENTKKQIRDKCNSFNVPLIDTALRDELSHSIGAENAAAVAVSDTNFAKAILEICK
jgi:ribosomal protein L7Ae-like RNA K-turn-binding protein